MAKKRRSAGEVNAGSMADIAFLLLIFFLVTTKIPNDKGLPIILPPKKDPDALQEVELHDHNVFTVLVNSRDQLLVEGEPMKIRYLQAKAIEFLDNKGRKEDLSDSPQEAVVSLKTDRGTKYETYMRVLDELQGAYNTLRANHMKISLEEYLAYDREKASKKLKEKYSAAKAAYPLRLSEAEPTNVGGK